MFLGTVLNTSHAVNQEILIKHLIYASHYSRSWDAVLNKGSKILAFHCGVCMQVKDNQAAKEVQCGWRKPLPGDTEMSILWGSIIFIPPYFTDEETKVYKRNMPKVTVNKHQSQDSNLSLFNSRAYALLFIVWIRLYS